MVYLWCVAAGAFATPTGPKVNVSSTQGSGAALTSLPTKGDATSDATRMPDEMLRRARIDLRSVRRVGDFATPSGGRHEVFLGETTGGAVCLIDDVVSGTTPDGRPLHVYGSACSPRPLRRAVLMFKVGTARHQNGAETTDFVGVAHERVRSLSLTDEAGKTYEVPLNTMNGFRYELSSGSARAGARAVVVAYDWRGVEMVRRALT